MISFETKFYVTGGTLRRDASCYVVRRADEELHAGLRQGQFCYVLTSRQMGKSSLMVRTAARLREEGVGVAVLDLTAIGQNLTAEQWYRGLLSQMGQQLELEDELVEFWRGQTQLGPMQRWMRAIRDVLLPRYPGQVVIFVDEIDVVRGLPLSTDEFFAAIREFYNRRTEDAELERLSFCLLGVATPSDLIRDTRTTPFNIGQRIELHDFTRAEAASLTQGLKREPEVGAALLKRILYWTGGHPYLTQRLCQAAAEDTSVSHADGVDRLCEEMFFSPRAQERDDNLLFVRERMLRSEVELASLLSLYAQVHRRKRVRDDETNPLVSVLRLSGIVRVEGGRLRARNRIYQRVFDREWVRSNMPDAELRRQRAAYRRGVLRTAAIALVVIAALAVLAVTAIKERDRALRQEVTNRRLLYAAQMSQAQQHWTAANLDRMQQLLLSYLPQAGQEDLRGFEWSYLWRLCHGYEFSLPQGESVYFVAFSPDSRKLAVGSSDVVKLWDVATGRELRTFKGSEDCVAFSPDGKKIVAALSGRRGAGMFDLTTGQQLMIFRHPVFSVAFSPDGKKLATGGYDSMANLWDAATGQEIMTLPGHTKLIKTVAFSPDGQTLATGSDDLTMKLWNVVTGRELKTFTEYHQPNVDLTALAFSPDGKTFVADMGGAVKVWDLTTDRERLAIKHGMFTLAISPDSKIIAVGGYDRVTDLLDAATGQSLALLRGHSGEIFAIAFSPDGRYLATGSRDLTTKLWSLARVLEKTTLTAHEKAIFSVALSPDDAFLATGSEDSTAKLWRLATGENLATFRGHVGGVFGVALSPDGKKLATGSEDRTAKLWDAATGQELATLIGHTAGLRAVCFSPDGRTVATGSNDHTAKLWEAATGREIATLTGHIGQVTGLAFAPDGQRLATGGGEGAIKLWQAETGQLLTTFDESVAGWVAGLAFSRDGRKLAAACRDGSIRVWDLATGQRLATLIGHGGRARSVAFSPDGQRLASGGDDQMVKLWDVDRQQEVLNLRRDGKVYSVAFSSDGLLLIAGGGDGKVELYRAASIEQVWTQSKP